MLLEEPGRVYLGDLRQAFVHLVGGGRLRDTPTASYVGGDGVGGGVPSINVSLFVFVCLFVCVIFVLCV